MVVQLLITKDSPCFSNLCFIYTKLPYFPYVTGKVTKNSQKWTFPVILLEDPVIHLSFLSDELIDKTPATNTKAMLNKLIKHIKHLTNLIQTNGKKTNNKGNFMC